LRRVRAVHAAGEPARIREAVEAGPSSDRRAGEQRRRRVSADVRADAMKVKMEAQKNNPRFELAGTKDLPNLYVSVSER
jgi:hypothetical protein